MEDFTPTLDFRVDYTQVFIEVVLIRLIVRSIIVVYICTHGAPEKNLSLSSGFFCLTYSTINVKTMIKHLTS